MAKELAFDLMYGVGSEDEILELSYATSAEELQLQETLKDSMIAFTIINSDPSSSSSATPEAVPSPTSELSLEGLDEELQRGFDETVVQELEDTVAEAFEKHECPVCHELWCTECTVSQDSELNCYKQQRISWNEKGRENFMPRRPRWRAPTRHFQSKFNGRRIGDTPQITSRSSNKFPAKRSSEVEDVFTADTGKNWQDNPKGKGIAIDRDWLLVSKRNHNSRDGRSDAAERWGSQCANPSKGSKAINRELTKGNFVKVDGVHNEDDCDSLDEDEFDSDTSQKSHETRKKSKWFGEFFERMDALKNEEIGETLWHCPACRGGAGAIKWYRSIDHLIAHSKKVGARRVKVHRDLAGLLEEELRRKGAPITRATAQIAGNWRGLKEDARDHEIVWPPMVVIMNTMINIDTTEKCVGMGSQVLLEHFSTYPALKAQHSYGPQGHRGLSVLIFESSAMGYLEAERLHKNFVEQGLDRFAWNSCSHVILPGGERQLYGFMAVKEDLDIFNQHCQGKSRIKYELKSYQEAVLNEVKKMNEDSQQLTWLKDRLAEERKRAETLEKSVHNLCRNLQRKMNDIRIFERRVQSLQQQNKEEMDFQENFYKDQIKILEAKVKEFEELKESYANTNLQPEEPEPAMGCLMDEGTLQQQLPYLSGLNE